MEEARHSLGAIYGRVLQSTQVGGVILAEHRYGSQLRMPSHWHDHPHLYLVLDGGCTDHYARNDTACGPLTLVFHPAGARHAAEYGNRGAHTFGIELLPAWMERVGEPTTGWDRSSAFRQGLPVSLALRLYRELCQPDTVSPLAIEGLVLELMAEIARCGDLAGERRLPIWLRQAREILAAEFAEPPSLTDLARAVGRHPSHLAREFRRQFRCTPGGFVRELRLEQAARELVASNTPLAELAAESGFSDQSHFSRAFKRHTGLTPSEFRTRYAPR